MDDEKTPRFDPRFSPAFQRGFDPRAPIEKSIPGLAEIRMLPAVEAGEASTGADGVPASPTGGRTDAIDATAAAELVDDAEADPAVLSDTSRNPFLLSLGVVAVLLMVTGIWLFTSTRTAVDGRPAQSQGEYMSLDAIIQAAPFIALLGVATAIGVLFVFAARWRKRR